MKKLVVSLCVGSLIATVLAVTPAAARATRCPAFEPSAVPEGTPSAEASLRAPVQVVTDKHTEADPLVIAYEHGVAAAVPLTPHGVLDYRYFNFQVRSQRVSPGLHIKAEWPITSPTDIDVYLFEESGSQIAWGEAWNLPVIDDVSDRLYYEGHGGVGYEYMEGVRASNCAGYSMWSRTSRSPGTPVSLKVWIGPQEAHYDDCCP